MARSGKILAILSECPESKCSVLLFSDKKRLLEKKISREFDKPVVSTETLEAISFKNETHQAVQIQNNVQIQKKLYSICSFILHVFILSSVGWVVKSVAQYRS